ncbi:glycerol-3-phosphate dehydrogenase [Rhodobacterales bacterium 52_120_T64]|nr:glycerol-3-phosphate dehydrogenase [Rhodobacterales bacterium 52_120_T64]
MTDIIIIGGGIAGGSLAAAVSADADVVLLEAEDVFGYHATGRSAAMYEPNYGNTVINTLTRASLGAFKEADVLSPRGVLYLADESEQHLMDAIAASDFTDRISLDEAHALVPILNMAHIKGAVMSASASDLDVDKLFQSRLRTARRNGAQLHTKAGVTGIRFDGQWHVQTAIGEFSAPVIVNAAGAWADKIAELAGVAPVGIQPFRRSVARLPAPAGLDIADWPMLLSATETWYAKPDAGKWLVSSAEEDPVDPMDAWADDMVLAEGLARYQEFVTEEITRVEGNWAGLRSFAPDRTPAVGFDRAAKGFFWLAGQGGYGVQTSPALSALAADLIFGRTPDFDAKIVADLSPARGM